MRTATTKRRYYHGTSAKYLPSIKSRGLLGSPPQRVWQKEIAAIPGYVYLTTDLGVALGYAHSAGKHEEDVLIAVLELDRDDPRIMADEDIVSEVTGRLSDQGILYLPPNVVRRTLPELWDLAHGKPGPGTKPYTRPHLVDLMKATENHPQTLHEVIAGYLSTKDPKDPYHVLPLPWEEDKVDHDLIDRLTKNLQKRLAEMLTSLGLTRFVSPERAIEFASSKVPEQLAAAPRESKGVRSTTWQRHRAEWERAWPEWFGPEAGLVAGAQPTVAAEAKTLKPDELWVISRGTSLRGLNRYNDLPKYGRRVASQRKGPTPMRSRNRNLDASIERLAKQHQASFDARTVSVHAGEARKMLAEITEAAKESDTDAMEGAAREFLIDSAAMFGAMGMNDIDRELTKLGDKIGR